MLHECTDATFTQEVTEHPGLVLVEFYGKDCGPCRMMEGILMRFSETQPVKVCKVLAQDNPQLAKAHGVTKVPTFVLMRGEQALATLTGFQPLSRLIAEVQKVQVTP